MCIGLSGDETDDVPMKTAAASSLRCDVGFVALSARAHSQQGRLRIPVGNGKFVTLPEMVGIGEI